MGDYERCEFEGVALEWLRKSFKLVSSTFIQYTNSAHLEKNQPTRQTEIGGDI